MALDRPHLQLARASHLALVLALMSGCPSPGPGTRAQGAEPAPPEAPGRTEPPAPTEVPGIAIAPLAENVWLHTSYHELPGIGPFPSHGLLVKAGGTLYLIDTAWSETQTRELLALAEKQLSMRVEVAVVTHAHGDKMGGMGALHAAGVITHAHPLSNRDAPTRDLQPARHDLALVDASVRFADGAIEVFYPGPGHTRDNIVVYLPQVGVLHGGCLIRPGASRSLGNTADADIGHWDTAALALAARYPEVQVVVPSHGPPGGPELLQHTATLVERHRSR